jgi:hypothetical protein
VSRFGLACLAVLSLLATGAMLAGGVGASSTGADLAAALGGQRTTTVPVAMAAPVATPAAVAEAEAPAAEEAAATTGATAAEEVAPAAEESAADSGEDDAAADPGTSTTAATDEAPRRTNIEHVFVIALAGHGFDATFGPQSPATYLNSDLRPKGALLTEHSTLGGSGLADGLALVGGQPPNADTRAGCTTYSEIPQSAKPTKSGEIRDTGCVFPSTVVTVADQVTASGRAWRAYVEDLDKGPGAKASCRRPASNAADDTVTGRAGDGYATRLNPFVYFHSLLDLGDCDAADGPLERLETDLGAVKTTPAYSYIAPNLCNSATEAPCADGSAGGLAAADAFLARWVPKILASKAYQKSGLLIVTFTGDVAAPTAAAPARAGTLLVSRFATAGSTVDTKTDPYALLRTIEDVLGVRPLARAAKATSLLDTVLAAARIARPGDD